MYGILVDGKVVGQFAAPMTVRSYQPAFVSDSLSLKRFVNSRPAQRWEISSPVVPLSSDAQDLFTLLVTSGVSETVQVRMPQNSGVIKARTLPSVIPRGTGGVRSTSVNVSNNNGFLPKGTFVRFDNHSKIYMLKTNLSNNGTVEIFPPLRVGVSGTNMRVNDEVDGVFRFDTDTVIGMVYTDGILMDNGTITLVEDV